MSKQDHGSIEGVEVAAQGLSYDKRGTRQTLMRATTVIARRQEQETRVQMVRKTGLQGVHDEK
jgi:hypothetical protein